MEKIRVGFIVGPTGTGKSALAVEIAGRLGAEIVNADSRLLYRGMDIGTAKLPVAERCGVPHHLIDVRSPEKPLDVAGFRELARRAIAGIAWRGRAIIVTGGSGFYLKVMQHGIFDGPPASRPIRIEFAALAAERGTAYLHDRLREIDPEAASRISPGDLCRITRALEVFRLTGTPISVHQRRHAFAAAEYDAITVGLDLPRERLYAAIEDRFDAMVAAGLVDEVRGLLRAGLATDAPVLRTIGYRQIAAYVRGELSLADAIATAKRDTRRLAKRQMTWFRSDPAIVWIDPDRGREQAFALFRDFLPAGRKWLRA
ncbi:MAG: tRNA (adenosine(37)-N6)-dimethylallyltransferase MiaA [Candidatus Binataceae bacterium]